MVYVTLLFVFIANAYESNAYKYLELKQECHSSYAPHFSVRKCLEKRFKKTTVFHRHVLTCKEDVFLQELKRLPVWRCSSAKTWWLFKITASPISECRRSELDILIRKHQRKQCVHRYYRSLVDPPWAFMSIFYCWSRTVDSWTWFIDSFCVWKVSDVGYYYLRISIGCILLKQALSSQIHSRHDFCCGISVKAFKFNR